MCVVDEQRSTCALAPGSGERLPEGDPSEDLDVRGARVADRKCGARHGGCMGARGYSKLPGAVVPGLPDASLFQRRGFRQARIAGGQAERLEVLWAFRAPRNAKSG